MLVHMLTARSSSVALQQQHFTFLVSRLRRTYHPDDEACGGACCFLPGIGAKINRQSIRLDND